jgi:hypothetical protein
VQDFHSGNYVFIGSRNGIVTHSKDSNSLSGMLNLKKSGLAIHKKSFAYECITSNIRMNWYSDIVQKVWIEQNSTGTKIILK